MLKFFLENTEYSMMRLISFTAVIAGLITSAAVLVMGFMKYEEVYLRELIYLSATLLGFGFGGKAAQKFAESDSHAVKTDTKTKVNAERENGQ